MIIVKTLIGIVVGLVTGMFTTSFFLQPDASLAEIFFTKITATSIISGLCCGIYASYSNSKFQIFTISIVLGIVIFYSKYLITGHHFDPITMGAFTGGIIGACLSITHKIMHSLKVQKKLSALRNKGFKK